MKDRTIKKSLSRADVVCCPVVQQLISTGIPAYRDEYGNLKVTCGRLTSCGDRETGVVLFEWSPDE